ncbi:MAG: F5/8 type C domain protein [Lentisphaerae bacterium ADurb.BinA184]|nr:MAG: F5/8 type C domain protein [Lentisphaerae bacterium ADurb.BinA184]
MRKTVVSVVTGLGLLGFAGMAAAAVIGYDPQTPSSWPVSISESKASSEGAPRTNTYDHKVSTVWYTTSATGWIMYDLGASTTLNRFSYWNYANSTTVQVKDYRLYVTDTSTGYANSAPADASWGSALKDDTMKQAWMLPVWQEQQVAISATGRYVLLVIDSNYGAPINSGLTEVAFNQPDVVPEPAGNDTYQIAWTKASSIADNSLGYRPSFTVDGNKSALETLSNEVNCWFMYDLGMNFDVNKMSIWNTTSNRGVKDFALYFTSSASNFDSYADFGHGPLTDPELAAWGSPVLTGSLLNDYSQQNFDITANGRYALLKVNSTWGSTQYVGFAEIQFEGVPAVPVIPEPAALAVLALGAGAAVLRRRHGLPRN